MVYQTNLQGFVQQIAMFWKNNLLQRIYDDVCFKNCLGLYKNKFATVQTIYLPLFKNKFAKWDEAVENSGVESGFERKAAFPPGRGGEGSRGG